MVTWSSKKTRISTADADRYILILCVEAVAARGFLPPGAKVCGATPPTGNAHPVL